MSSPPTTLGQYQIIREIARSNDIVYEAYDPLMNRRVAIKELMMPSGSTPQQAEDRISRFKREAQAAGTLNHPNIMTVYSFAEDAGRTFMAMEYLDGQTLRNELDARGAIPIDRAVAVTDEVLAGLEHAHSKGVIHRDIKPDNIQILSNGQIKITDFGIARLTFQPNLTMDGQVFGTPSYMSPEQVVGREIDARSDIFSVGVMLYEMIAGQKPFSGDSVVSTTYAIMNKEPDQPANIPWPLWTVITRALEKSPAMRWSSAADMKQALEEAMDPSKGAMPVVDPSVPPGYHPSTNPYAAPTPPPIAGIYGGPGPTSYGPYSMPGAGANPYANQYAPGPNAPVTFPYNPYAAGGGAYPPHTPGMVQPGGIPIYNPPPPRRPLISPDQLMFFKRLFLAFMIVGTLFALFFTGFEAIMKLAGRADDSASRVQMQQKTDDLRDAQQYQAQKDNVEAESKLGDAHQDDPRDPVPLVKSADLSSSEAAQWEQEAKYPEAALMYTRAADSYSQAMELEADFDKKADEREKYITSAFNSGRMAVLDPGMDPTIYQRSRLELERARTTAQLADPDLYRRMQDLLAHFEH